MAFLPKNPSELIDKWPIVAGGVGAFGLAYLAIKVTSALPDKRVIKYSIKFDETSYGGKIFAESFANHGVKQVFTLTGGHISPILVGCKAQGIRVVDVRHEVNTVFAADAVARLTGIPGVAVVTAGPGVSNTVTAVKNAQMAQSPVVIFGGATSDLLKGMGSLQDIDQFSLMKPHVKWMTHISRVRDIPSAVETAFQKAQEGTPGPVFVEVPLDILYREKLTREWYVSSKDETKSLVGRFVNWYMNRHLDSIFGGLNEISFAKPLPIRFPIASSRNVSKAAQYLLNAKQPVFMIGAQAMLDNEDVISGELTKAVEAMGIPVFLTGMARGLMGRQHQLQYRQKDTRRKALREADVVLLAGVPCDFRLNYGKNINSRAVFISVNRDKTDLYKNRTPTLPVLGDPCRFLIQLSQALKNHPQWSEWHSTLDQKEKEGEDKLEKNRESDGKEIDAIFACSLIEEVASENSIFIADGGDFVGTAAYILRPRGPLTWMDPGPFGTLGVGSGFAMGAKVCKPDSEVWIIFGDGAVGFSIAEFDTFARLKIPVIAVVGNDACWMQMLRGQIDFFNDDVACMLEFTHYDKVVEGFGAEGIIVNSRDEVLQALKKAQELAKEAPVLVNVIMQGRTDFRAGSLAM